MTGGAAGGIIFAEGAWQDTECVEIPDGDEAILGSCLDRLSAGEPGARDDLIARACRRMRGIAHRMLRRFPSVRRWDDTDDIVQNAAMKLIRAIDAIGPRTPRDFIGLAAVQIRRSLLDLARKHAGPESAAANHETGVWRIDGGPRGVVDRAADPAASPAALDRWTRFHETAEALPEEERELFHLVWYLGLSQQDAARMIGCSERTVRRRWEALKALLATAMADERLE